MIGKRKPARDACGLARQPPFILARPSIQEAHMRSRLLFGVMLLAGAGLLAGCGQKGPLVLPTKPAATPAAPAPAAPAPPAAPASASTAAHPAAASTRP